MPSDSPSADSPKLNGHDPYSALRLPDFCRYLSGNFISLVGMQMQTMAVCWQIYQRTESNYKVGLVGLIQVMPVIMLALFAGHIADRVNRKYIIMCSVLVVATASVGLALVANLASNSSYEMWTYGFLFVTGVARSFLQTAKSSLMPQLVPREIFTNAITWNAGAFHLAAVLGPAMSGWMIAWLGGAIGAFICNAVAAALFFVLLVQVRYQNEKSQPEAQTLKSLLGGVQYVWRQRLILGVMSLDMFAVLFGGAVALFPYFAKKVLFVDATGLGWMLATPAIGSVFMSIILSRRPPMERAGRNLLWCVCGFGLATIGFGLSQNLWVSLLMLFLTGVFDTVSVVVRHSIVQLNTPNSMRGRVSAINGIFIAISNELGSYESGTVAQLTTPFISVISGGLGTLVVVVVAALSLPELRRYGRLEGQPVEVPTSTEAEANGLS